MRITEEAVEAERDILDRVNGLPINLSAMAVASNLWRASQAFRREMERNVLRQYELSWASFSTLFIVWIWGPIGMSAIADHQSVSRPTISSTVNHLEKRGYCVRTTNTLNTDGRTIQVTLTDAGQTLIEEVFPKFNVGEAEFINCLTVEEQSTLTDLLRKLVRANREMT